MFSKKTYIILVASILLSVLPSASAAETQIGQRYAKKAQLTVDEAENQIALMIDSIKEVLLEGDSVQMRTFGTFYVQDRKPRTARNPRTGESVAVPAKRYPRFRSSQSFKDFMNK